MYHHSTFALLLAVGLIFNGTHSANTKRKNNANDNVFNMLLGLYKINPLKTSPVYRSFSTNLLTGMGRGNDDRVVLNSESSESLIENKQVKTNLNEIEKMIHTKNKKPVNFIERPAYDLNDVVSTENFNAEFVINDKVLSKEALQRTLLDDHNYREDFSSLFDHIGSIEADSEMSVTKLLPTKSTIIPYTQVSNQNKAVFGLADKKDISGNQIDSQPKIHDKNSKEIRINNSLGEIVDVIIF
ncbi:hypothetical protein PYW08_009493 [Mythimna loreyi]|uniref:Uncharacterized protein n=1 Tax=Mythimna loreyi TaxID=667449 RepID=A0ACC2Q8R2_9NEOP|nr:hypothetical protein PYW08_009493 [Mythimna loreyi]